jgi:hypothetical protein
LPIIRITKAQLEKADKARKAALLKNPEFRVYEERRQLRRDQAVSKLKERIKAANDALQAAPPNDQDSRPCDERQRQREAVAEMEQES